jgi:hypothetical protein
MEQQTGGMSEAEREDLNGRAMNRLTFPLLLFVVMALLGPSSLLVLSAVTTTRSFADDAIDTSKLYTLTDIYAELSEGRYALALQQLSPLSNNGNAEADFLLAYMLENGKGTSPDPARSLTLYRRSAAAGYVPAQKKMGMLEFQAENYTEALRILLPLAEKGARGDVSGALSQMYARGLGTPVDKARAQCWARKTAEPLKESIKNGC